jgi:hypothetical protein
MTDYLSDLAARSLARTEVILPRLASRFEPVPADGALGRSQPGSPEEPAGWTTGEPNGLARRYEPPTTTVPVAPQPAVSVTTPDPSRENAAAQVASAQRAPAVQDHRPAATASPMVQSTGQPRRSPEAASQQPESDRAAGSRLTSQAPLTPLRGDPGRPAEPAADGSVRPMLRSLSTPGDQDLDERIRAALHMALAQLHAGDRVQGPSPAGTATHQAPRPELAPVEDRLKPPLEPRRPETQPAAPARVVVQPQVVVAPPASQAPLDLAAPPRLGRQEPPLAPTIQVTIGRIEVRATPAPAAAPASKPKPAPVPSLDDYLRQRNGGSR